MKLCLAGDLMLGRGVDQILPRPSDPILYEDYLTSAVDYVELAERVHGTIRRPVAFDYVWGDVLGELEKHQPDVRFINLETAITTSDAVADKGVNYRMHPANIGALGAANIDGCTLANNHILDWGTDGLIETLQTLEQADVGRAGAGYNLTEAAAPWIHEIPGKGRIIVFAFGTTTSGIPEHWQAGPDRPGVRLLHDPADMVSEISLAAQKFRKAGDIIVVSVHWGGNWGYGIAHTDRLLAHALIEEAGVDIIHGHSSHHPKAIEIYRGKPIFYGCGDLLNDYEGIGGRKSYRGQLTLVYFVDIEEHGANLRTVEMVPLEMHRFRLQRPSDEGRAWIAARMGRECATLGAQVRTDASGTLSLVWC